MEFELGCEVLMKATIEHNKDKLYQRWLHGFHDKVSFKEFSKMLMEDEEVKPEEELKTLEKVKNILDGI